MIRYAATTASSRAASHAASSRSVAAAASACSSTPLRWKSTQPQPAQQQQRGVIVGESHDTAVKPKWSDRLAQHLKQSHNSWPRRSEVEQKASQQLSQFFNNRHHQHQQQQRPDAPEQGAQQQQNNNNSRSSWRNEWRDSNGAVSTQTRPNPSNNNNKNGSSPRRIRPQQHHVSERRRDDSRNELSEKMRLAMAIREEEAIASLVVDKTKGTNNGVLQQQQPQSEPNSNQDLDQHREESIESPWRSYTSSLPLFHPRPTKPFKSELKKSLKQKGPTTSSFRSDKNNLDTSSSSSTDMGDVSALKAHFLKTVEAHHRRKFQKPSLPTTTTPTSTATEQQPKSEWRTGAKWYRQRQQEQKKLAKEKRDQAYRARKLTTKEFFNTSPQEQRQVQQASQQQQQGIMDTKIILPQESVSVSSLSEMCRVSKERVLEILTDLGEEVSVDEQVSGEEGNKVDVDTMELVALELGLEPVRDTRRGTRKVQDDRSLLIQRRAIDTEALPPRPPVVACMGHVDHGKTTLMDSLRRKSRELLAAASASTAANQKTSKKKKKKKGNNNNKNELGDVAGTEAGGITQVISAFSIPLEQEQDGTSAAAAVTFLDTPGHAAFSAMRESGSHAADVICLVVAADDGVSPQTVEILEFYKSIVQEAADETAISLVVAMTKIDKPGIDIDESRTRIENQLLEHGIVTESMASASDQDNEFGPPVQLIPVSGLTGAGLDDLVQGLVLQSEVMDLRADQEASVEGIVMDARIEKGLGVVADCIVRWGSLNRGDVVVSGTHSGKVKILKDVNDKTLDTALPSQPVRIIGFETLPKAGDPLICVASEEKAKRLTEKRLALESSTDTSFRTENIDAPQLQVTGTASKTVHMTNMTETKYDLNAGEDESGTIRIPVVIKADADGTLAAVRDSLLEVGTMSTTYNIIVDPVGMGIGPILMSDVALAKQSGAAIFSFGLRKLNDKTTLSLADGDGVDVRCHNVIYSLLDDAKDVFAKHLPPVPVEVVHGSATVQAVFDINNKRNAERIAGLQVMEGTLFKSINTEKTRCHYRVLRNGTQVSPEDDIMASSLRKVKEDVDNVRRGDECGLGLEGFTDFEEGDVIECYSTELKSVFM